MGNLLTTPLLVSSAATAYCRFCKLWESMGSLEACDTGSEEVLSVAAEHVVLKRMLPLERQLPDLYRDERSIVRVLVSTGKETTNFR